LALNGAVAHAFVHIIYKALLFMSMGAVLHQVGTIKASANLAGFTRNMPFTMVCCIIGAMSISAFPLFSGFVAKSLTMSALGDSRHCLGLFGVLLFASAGVLEHSGIKIPYFAFLCA
jgi:multicomponent Na+:H+ antiporter subunit D